MSASSQSLRVLLGGASGMLWPALIAEPGPVQKAALAFSQSLGSIESGQVYGVV